MQKYLARLALTGIMVGLLHPATVVAQSAEQPRSSDRRDLSVSFTFAQPTIEQSSTADGTLSGMKYLGQERRFATQARIWKRLLLALAVHRANLNRGQGFSTDPQGVATSISRYQPTASHVSHNSLKSTAEHALPFLRGISVGAGFDQATFAVDAVSAADGPAPLRYRTQYTSRYRGPVVFVRGAYRVWLFDFEGVAGASPWMRRTDRYQFGPEGFSTPRSAIVTAKAHGQTFEGTWRLRLGGVGFFVTGWIDQLRTARGPAALASGTGQTPERLRSAGFGTGVVYRFGG
jgi:hypothetical protein